MFGIFMFLAVIKTLNIKSKTVGDGQYFSTGLATPKEINILSVLTMNLIYGEKEKLSIDHMKHIKAITLCWIS